MNTHTRTGRLYLDPSRLHGLRINWSKIKKYNPQRLIMIAYGGNEYCEYCRSDKPAISFGPLSNKCKDCRLRIAECKSGAAHLPISPEQRIYKAKERLGPVANKNQSLVLAKSAQIAIEEINQSYEKHPKLTARALQRLRATSKRPKAPQSGQGTEQCCG